MSIESFHEHEHEDYDHIPQSIIDAASGLLIRAHKLDSEEEIYIKHDSTFTSFDDVAMIMLTRDGEPLLHKEQKEHIYIYTMDPLDPLTIWIQHIDDRGVKTSYMVTSTEIEPYYPPKSDEAIPGSSSSKKERFGLRAKKKIEDPIPLSSIDLRDLIIGFHLTPHKRK